jgi:hypothetical protein
MAMNSGRSAAVARERAVAVSGVKWVRFAKGVWGLFSLSWGSKMASVGVLSGMAPEGRRRTGTSAGEFRPRCRSCEGSRRSVAGAGMGSPRKEGMRRVFFGFRLENGFVR